MDYLWLKPVDKCKKYGFEADLALLIKIYAVNLAALDPLLVDQPGVHFSIQNTLGESALDCARPLPGSLASPCYAGSS